MASIHVNYIPKTTDVNEIIEHINKYRPYTTILPKQITQSAITKIIERMDNIPGQTVYTYYTYSYGADDIHEMRDIIKITIDRKSFTILNN